MLERPRLVEAVGHGQRLAVIGDRDVLEAGSFARRAPWSPASARPSVAVVCMCGSPRTSCRSIRRGSVSLGGVDLAAVFAQLRRDEGQAECLVDSFFRVSGDANRVVDPDTGHIRSA